MSTPINHFEPPNNPIPLNQLPTQTLMDPQDMLPRTSRKQKMYPPKFLEAWIVRRKSCLLYGVVIEPTMRTH